MGSPAARPPRARVEIGMGEHPAAPAELVEALLAIHEEEALEEALAAVAPAAAGRAVAAAPTLERKTQLLWAMEDRQRRAALDLVPPALVGALVQNLEEDNRYLLGDLSFEQFRALLALCSPERRYYWVTLALSFTDARANALPLLLSTRELVEILLTHKEFEAHLRAIGDYPIEDGRLPPDLMADPAQALLDLLGPQELLRMFPLADPVLATVLQTVLDYDPDRYVDLLRHGLRAADYAANHPLEWESLVEAPVLLESLVLPAPAEPQEALPDAGPDAGPPLSLVPVTAAPLARLAGSLPAGQRARLADELQQLYIRQAVAEGGSFHLPDLARVARSVEAYLLIGLEAESGGRPERQAALLAGRPLDRLGRSGARVVEALRQVALRLAPLENCLDAGQRALVRSLVRPRLGLDESGAPILRLQPGGSLPESIPLPGAAELLSRTALWADVARALGVQRTAEALQAAGSTDALLEELAVGAVIYGRVEPGLAVAADRRRLARRYVPDAGAPPRTEAMSGLREAAERWARAAGVPAGRLLSLLEPALLRAASAGGE